MSPKSDTPNSTPKIAFAPGLWYIHVGRVDRAGHSAALARDGRETQSTRRILYFSEEAGARRHLALMERAPRRTYRVERATEHDRPRPPRRRDRSVQLTLC